MNRRSATFLLAAFTAAGVMATLGFYWDETWHTDRGRDSFWIPAHQMLYAGVGILFAVAVSFGYLLYRNGWPLGRVARHWPLVLAASGSALCLLDAPIDGVWHNVFGRDAVFWSPPHVLAVASLSTCACGLLLLATEQPGRAGQFFTAAATGLVMASLLVLVMEYESDVPQFDVFWYLPVVALTASLTFTLVRLVTPLRWVATWSSIWYALLMAGVVLFLTALDFSTPIVPVIAISALLFDVGAQREWPQPLRAVLFVSAVYVTYALYLNYVLDGVRISGNDIALGVPLAAALSWAIMRLVEPPQPALRPVVVAAPLACLLLLWPLGAAAHDPGQGPKVGFVDFVATNEEGMTHVVVQITEPADCGVFEPNALVARRARKELRAALTETAPCRLEGDIALPGRGRWFVYIELRQDSAAREAWLPVIAGDDGRRFTKTSWMYVPPTREVNAAALVSGALIYALSLGLFIMVAVAYRQTRAMRLVPV